MKTPKNYLNWIFSSILISVTSAFLFTGVAYADTLNSFPVQSPLLENTTILQEQAKVVSSKSDQLNDTSKDVQDLQSKKQTLAQQLDAEKQRIADLKQQIADKKAAAEAAAKAQEAVAAPVQTVSYSAPSGAVAGCGDNEYAHFIYMHESGCRTHNPNGSGCDGIGQACPASKVIGPCGYDYACQNAWFTEYANKYGGWAGAYQFWLGHGWW